ncbi:septal ring lytic transglycosylase RlpA family protein [Aurantivibrio plasticivorans]
MKNHLPFRFLQALPLIRLILVAGFSLFALTGCISLGKQDIKDSGPPKPVDVAHVPDAVPRVEPRTSAGNKSPYTVLGKTYSVLPESHGFTQRGYASWYGRKFHGRRTSNGEVYNMYGMTAAHKNLPIPTFVTVRNIENGKEVIVRVNDRGPFHGDRIIDLTYAAAKKLGFVDKGTAMVEIAAIDPVAFHAERNARETQSQQASQSSAPVVGTFERGKVTSESTFENAEGDLVANAPDNSAGYSLAEPTYLQAGAFSDPGAANSLQQKIRALTQYPVFVEETISAAKRLFRVRIGPIADNFELVSLQSLIEQQRLGKPHVVR